MICPFCESNAHLATFANSANFKAIYNVAPILPGHSLVIPQKHTQSLMDFNHDELSEMIIFMKDITGIILKVFNTDAFNWSIQEKETAGQTLSHLHFHIVPRYPDDFPDPGDWYPRISNNYEKILDSDGRKKITDKEMEKIVEKLRGIAIERNLYNPH